MTEWEVSVAKILVVNDDPSMRQALARALANWGYESVEIDDDRGTFTVAVSKKSRGNFVGLNWSANGHSGSPSGA
jgi:DNA-binding response OmpR family regulator